MSDISTPPNVRIVHVREADLSAIVSLVNRAFMVHGLMTHDRIDLEGLIEEAGPDGRFLLAERDGRLIGAALVRPVNADDDHGAYSPPPKSLYFGPAAVDTTLMRSGIGRLLLTEAERYARENSFTHLALNTLYEFDLVPYYLNFGCIAMAEEAFDAGHWGLPEPHRLCHMEKVL